MRILIFAAVLLAACSKPAPPSVGHPVAPASEYDPATPGDNGRLTKAPYIPPNDPPVPKPPPPPKEKITTAALVVKSSTWHESGPLIHIGEYLKHQFERVELTLADDAPVRISAEYQEQKGILYKNQFGSDAGYATTMHLKLTVHLPGEELPVLTYSAYSEPSTYITTATDRASRDAFYECRAFEMAGSFVAVALGDRERHADLLPLTFATSLDEAAIDLLRRAGYRPQEPADVALWALAEKDIARCVAVGAEALPVIARQLKSLIDGFGNDTLESLLIEALVKLGNPDATPILLDYLARQADSVGEMEDDATLPDYLQVALDALAKVGDKRAIEALNTLADGDSPKPVRQAASSAAAAVRKRLDK